MHALLPMTGTNQLLRILDPFVPDGFINDRWKGRPARGPRPTFSAAQLWRLQLLALLTPVHSFNLLLTMLPEQPAWRQFARLGRRQGVPEVRRLHEFRARVGVAGLRAINDTLLQPLVERAVGWEHALALMDATDLEAACRGFKKKTPARIPPTEPPWGAGRSRRARVGGLSATRSTPCGCGGANTPPRCGWCLW
jgi:hypothetical protein